MAIIVIIIILGIIMIATTIVVLLILSLLLLLYTLLIVLLLFDCSWHSTVQRCSSVLLWQHMLSCDTRFDVASVVRCSIRFGSIAVG